MANTLEVEGKEILIKSSKGLMAVIPKDKVSWVKGQIESGNHGVVDKYVNSLSEYKYDNQKAGDGMMIKPPMKAMQSDATRVNVQVPSMDKAKVVETEKVRMFPVGPLVPFNYYQERKKREKQKAEDGMLITPPLGEDEKKNTLYVNNPKDPRLQAYQDSLSTFNNFYKVNDIISKIKDNQFSSIKETDEYVNNLQKLNPVNKALLSKFPKEKIQKIRTLKYPEANVTWQIDQQATKPKRPVVLMPEPIEPRYSTPTLAQPEPITPTIRPVSVPAPINTEEPVEQKTVIRKGPKAVMPTRQGGWSNQSLLMRLFPQLYEK